MFFEAVFLFGAIGIGIFLAKRHPESAERWYYRIATARRGLFALISLLFALLFIASGVFPLMIIGALLVFYGTLLFVFEKPHEEVQSWIT